MLKLESVYKLYQSGAVETTALNKISLNIEKGEFIAIMGPSGCGKSTLLNVIGLLDGFKSGSYKFQGTEVANFKEGERAELRKKSIGFIFQSFNLIDELTVLENVQLALKYHGLPKKESKEMALHALGNLGIAHRAEHFPKQLSGGQQQRVAIARATVAKPSVILADEPTGNLDSANGADVMNLLTTLNSDGTTVVMVTHSEEHAAYAKRVVRLHDGKIVSHAATSEKVA